MSTFTTADGTTLHYKDWGSRDARPVVFHHGWPSSSDDWDDQMLFFLARGYRVVAHDRRGHGRSDRTDTGNDMDTCAADVGELADHLDLRDAVHVGHSTGGGEVARYAARAPVGRVAKVALLGVVPRILLRTEANPDGIPMSVFDGFRAALAANRAKFLGDVPSEPFSGFDGPAAIPSEGLIRAWWRQAVAGGGKAHRECIRTFSETDFMEDLRALAVPVLLLRGGDDRAAPVAASAHEAIDLLGNAALEVYADLARGRFVTELDPVNADLLAFVEA